MVKKVEVFYKDQNITHLYERLKMEYDSKLGSEVHEVLKAKGIETPFHQKKWIEGANQVSCVEDSVAKILGDLGMDLEDDSLKDTPKRVAKMFCEEIFEGLDYDKFPKCTTIRNKMGYDEIITVRNSVVRSTCEHHLQPIYGRATIAYIPGDLVLGLSKFTRVVDFFASRPQVQERLTEQVYAALSHILQTEDIAVIIEAEHFCMKMRGVEEACSDTVTSKMGGRFKTNLNPRDEVLQLLNHRRPQ